MVRQCFSSTILTNGIVNAKQHSVSELEEHAMHSVCSSKSAANFRSNNSTQKTAQFRTYLGSCLNSGVGSGSGAQDSTSQALGELSIPQRGNFASTFSL